MMSPRIALADPDHMNAHQRQVYDSIVSGPRGRLVGPLRAVLLIPELAERWSHFGEYLRFSTSLPPRLKELAIVVTARHWNSQVEWQIHSEAAVAAGVPQDVVAAIRIGRLPHFADAADGEVYEFSRRLLEDGDVGAPLHARLTARWGEAGVVELTAVIGYYAMVSLMLNAQAIPPLPGETPLSPVDGRRGVTPLPAWIEEDSAE